MNPHERITSSTPCRRNHSIMYVMNGRPASGTTGLGIDEVSGRSRVALAAGEDQGLQLTGRSPRS